MAQVGNALATVLDAGFNYICSSPANELFAFVYNLPTFYSNDGGQTWTHLSIPPFSQAVVTNAIYTPGGKLLVATQAGIYVSADKGNTWTSTAGSQLTPPVDPIAGDSFFNCPAVDNGGNLYVVAQTSQTIYKSTDNGTSWQPLAKTGGEADFALYIDNTNNRFYKGRSDANGGIYISKDNGATYAQLTNSANSFLDAITLQTDGNYYFENYASAISTTSLYQFTGTSGVTKLLYNLPPLGTRSYPQAPPYIVASNNNIVLVNRAASQTIYFKK